MEGVSASPPSPCCTSKGFENVDEDPHQSSVGYVVRCNHCGSEHVCNHPPSPPFSSLYSPSMIPPPPPPPSYRPSLRPWRRILYERQPYPDNYTDRSFLSQLVTNANVISVPYFTLVCDSAVISTRIGIVAVFIAVFYHLSLAPHTIHILIIADILLVIAGSIFFLFMHYTIYQLEEKQQQTNKAASGEVNQMNVKQKTANGTKSVPAKNGRKQSDNNNNPPPIRPLTVDPVVSDNNGEMVKGSLAGPFPPSFSARYWMYNSLQRLALLIGCLLGVSPVLKTLTQSYSNDTIWALTFFFSAIHLVLHDYHYINHANSYPLGSPYWLDGPSGANPSPSSTKKYQQHHSQPPPLIHPTNHSFRSDLHGTISLNAGIFASVLLASRLPSALHVFGFLFFAFEIFAGFPMLAHHIRRWSLQLHLAMALLICCIALQTIIPISNLLALVFFFTIFFINFFCPLFFKWVHRYKNEIHGPWDYDDAPELDSDNL